MIESTPPDPLGDRGYDGGTQTATSRSSSRETEGREQQASRRHDPTILREVKHDSGGYEGSAAAAGTRIEGRTAGELNIEPKAAPATEAEQGEDGVLDALLGLTVRADAVSAQGSAGTSAASIGSSLIDNIKRGGSSTGVDIPRENEAIAGRGGGSLRERKAGAGDDVVVGGADELEDWLDDMLADD